MKVSDYIVEFLIEKRVTDIFGYPGGVICHVMDSVTKYHDRIVAHALYHEQACAFAACSYAQAARNLGVAFATSGPGATNLVTGIANAFYDSIPVLFLTGNVDTYGVKGHLNIRQRGFQETDFVSIVKSITKYSIFVSSPEDIRYCLEKAYHLATSGRMGPVVLDLPADVQRADVDVSALKSFADPPVQRNGKTDIECVINDLTNARRPCFLAGAAVKQTGSSEKLKFLCEKFRIPLVTSLPALGILPYDHPLNGGFIGTNGQRFANFIVSKADLLITIGSRLDLKQVGNIRTNFAPKAKLYRVDIDAGELAYKVRDDEIPLNMDLSQFLDNLALCLQKSRVDAEDWIGVCGILKDKLQDVDMDDYHKFIKYFSMTLPEDINITVDTGQSSIWVPQAFVFKDRQSFFVSAGLGSMGYSLPAAIGAYYATKKPVVCFNGDAGFQMNIQELEFIVKERLPITVVILNNNSLGMIRQFQEKNFNENYFLTTTNSGYAAPNFGKIASAYGFEYSKITSLDNLEKRLEPRYLPAIFDVQFKADTYLLPNFRTGRPLEDMDPFIERDLYSEMVLL
jgi:acetolactate synthase-1/2/3 large subunit